MEKYIVKLTNGERENLFSLTKTGKIAAQKLIHARILLETDENTHGYATDQFVAEALDISEKTVQMCLMFTSVRIMKKILLFVWMNLANN